MRHFISKSADFTTPGLWEQVWGEHIHHSYYSPDEGNQKKTKRQAQIDLIEELLKWAGVQQAKNNILDVGWWNWWQLALQQKNSAPRQLELLLSPVQKLPRNAPWVAGAKSVQSN